MKRLNRQTHTGNRNQNAASTQEAGWKVPYILQMQSFGTVAHLFGQVVVDLEAHRRDVGWRARGLVLEQRLRPAQLSERKN